MLRCLSDLLLSESSSDPHLEICTPHHFPQPKQTQGEDDEETVNERLQLAAEDHASNAKHSFEKCKIDDGNGPLNRATPVLFAPKSLVSATGRKSFQNDAPVCRTVNGDAPLGSCECKL